MADKKSRKQEREERIEIKKLLSSYLYNEDTNIESAAMLSDKAVFEAETACDVETGKCTEQDAVENLIDRQTARVSVWFSENGKEIVERAFEAAGIGVGILLSRWVGPNAILISRKIGQVLGRTVSKTAEILIDKGIRKIGQFGKKLWNWTKEKVARPLYEKMKKTCNFS